MSEFSGLQQRLDWNDGFSLHLRETFFLKPGMTD